MCIRDSQYPIGKEHELNGYVDLITMKAYVYADAEKQEFIETDIPSGIKDRVQELHEILIEKVAEADDSLMEKYLEDGVLEIEEIYTALRIHTLSRKIFPVLGGDSRMADTKVLLDSICRYLPSPYQKVYTYHDPETSEITESLGKVVAADADTKEKVALEINENEEFVALVFKVAVDPHIDVYKRQDLRR